MIFYFKEVNIKYNNVSFTKLNTKRAECDVKCV